MALPALLSDSGDHNMRRILAAIAATGLLAISSSTAAAQEPSILDLPDDAVVR